LFPGRLPEPTRDTLSGLMDMVQGCSADMGVALDGDADRAVFVDENGGYLDGDKTLALMAHHLVSTGEKCVTPVSSSSCVSDVVKKRGGEMVYTRVGAPLVARKMIEVSAVFGGEENGGLIFPRHQYCRDGGMAMAAMLDIMALTGKTVSQVAGEVPSYALYKGKISCPRVKQGRVLRGLVDLEDGKMDLTDGVKIFLPDGWVLVRSSGTEPLIRVYGEARDPKTAETLARRYLSRVQEMIQ
jgi:phosphomannomutase/phosphoglucomutase